MKRAPEKERSPMPTALAGTPQGPMDHSPCAGPLRPLRNSDLKLRTLPVLAGLEEARFVIDIE